MLMLELQIIDATENDNNVDKNDVELLGIWLCLSSLVPVLLPTDELLVFTLLSCYST